MEDDEVIKFKHKQQEYFDATRQIVKARVRLREIFIPKIIMKNEAVEFIYPDKFYEHDAMLEASQNQVFDYIFKDELHVLRERKGGDDDRGN